MLIKQFNKFIPMYAYHADMHIFLLETRELNKLIPMYHEDMFIESGIYLFLYKYIYLITLP